MNLAILLPILLVLPPIAWAKDKSVGFSYQSYNSANDYNDQRFGASYDDRWVDYFQNKDSDYLSGGAFFTGFSLKGTRVYRQSNSVKTSAVASEFAVQFKLSDWVISARPGWHKLLNSALVSDHERFIYSLSGQNIYLDKTLLLELKVFQDFNYFQAFVESGLDAHLAATGQQIRSEFSINSQWQMNLELIRSEFSDSNDRSQQKLSVLYSVFPETSWLWLGAGADHLTYSKQNPGYWSPSDFLAVGPRLEMAFTLSDNWVLGAAGSLMSTQESGYSVSKADHASLFADYSPIKELKLKLGYAVVNSQQAGIRWWSSHLTGSFFYLF